MKQSVNKCRKIKYKLLKSLCIKLSIEHSTTCDSITHLDYMSNCVCVYIY